MTPAGTLSKYGLVRAAKPKIQLKLTRTQTGAANPERVLGNVFNRLHLRPKVGGDILS